MRRRHETNRLEQQREITRGFPTFLGLRLLPAGVWFVIVALMAPLSGELPTLPLAVLAAAMVGAIWWIHSWYGRELGTVQPPRLELSRSRAFLVAIGVAAVAMWLSSSTLDAQGTLVLFLTLLLLVSAASFALPRVAGGGGGAIAIVIAIVALGVAAILFVARDPETLGSVGMLFSLTVGLMVSVAGLLEHRHMMAVLRSAEVGASD